MIAPERRTRGDLIAAAAIAVTVAVFIGTVWWNSSTRATISRPADAPAAKVDSAESVPAALQQRWTATSARTLTPIVVSNTVVTADTRPRIASGVLPCTSDWRILTLTISARPDR